jgi:acyl-coenzyme A thioesterase PaaI-like protein
MNFHLPIAYLNLARAWYEVLTRASRGSALGATDLPPSLMELTTTSSILHRSCHSTHTMSMIRQIMLQQRLASLTAPRFHPTALRLITRPSHILPRLHRRHQSTIPPQDPILVQQPLQPPPRPSRFRTIPLRILKTLLTATLFFTIGLYAGYRSLPPGNLLDALSAKSPSDAESLDYRPEDEEAARVNNTIVNHPLATALRAQGTDGVSGPVLKEQRPHMKIPEVLRKTNLTGGTLAGPGKIVVPPLTFIDPAGSQLVSLFYLGANLCGHPGIIHGGLLATLLDEGLARCSFPNFESGVAVTASLKVSYRKPVKAEGYYVLRAETERVEGRKAWVRGWIERLDEESVGVEGGQVKKGERLVEAEALFVEPRNAKVRLLIDLEDGVLM